MAITSTTGLVDALRQHRVLSQANLDEVAGSLQGPCADARALVRELMQRGWLTAYQVNQLVQGRGSDLVLGPYVLLERLGEGGMGTVFKARHQLMDRTVALKLIRKEYLEHADAVERFHREIRLAAKLDHPHLVRAYDAAQVGDTHFLVMEYAEGADLQRLIRKSGPLPVGQACAYMQQAALGLQHAAERGLVHRDIKPSNLQVTGQGTVLKILDMGLARVQAAEGDQGRGGEVTQARTVLGTPDYIAPEQIADARSVDARADIYSLGCTFYFLLAGRPPFPEGEWQEKLTCHRKVEPQAIVQLRPDAPPGVGAVLRKMMAKRPEDRYQTAAEVAEALAPFGHVNSPGPAVDMAILAARPEAPTISAAQVGATPASLMGQTGGYEPNRALETNAHIDATPTQEQRHFGFPVQPATSSAKRSWLLLAGGAALGLLILLLILRWSGSGDADSHVDGNNPPPTNANTVPAGDKGTPGDSPAAPPPLVRAPFGEAKAKELQLAWAKYLGRKVVEQVDLDGGVSMEFVLIPPGTYTMGSPKAEIGHQADEEEHEVTITRPFYLGKYLVTQEQYERVAGGNPSCFKAGTPLEERLASRDTRRFPVESVSWTDADACCARLERKLGRKVRLPTEAEWEYACRAGTTTAFHFGTQLNGTQANCNGQKFPYSTPEKGPDLERPCEVGSYRQSMNAWGLYDMHGNVHQWCADWYGPYILEDTKDPHGQNTGEKRILRGGSWDTIAMWCRAACRYRVAPALQYGNCGFRMCLD